MWWRIEVFGVCVCVWQGWWVDLYSTSWTWPLCFFFFVLVCSAAVGVGFYGNSETNDGVYQLTYSLYNANHTLGGVDNLVGGRMQPWLSHDLRTLLVLWNNNGGTNYVPFNLQHLQLNKGIYGSAIACKHVWTTGFTNESTLLAKELY